MKHITKTAVYTAIKTLKASNDKPLTIDIGNDFRLTCDKNFNLILLLFDMRFDVNNNEDDNTLKILTELVLERIEDVENEFEEDWWGRLWNEDGINRETGTEYDPDGYNQHGFNEYGVWMEVWGVKEFHLNCLHTLPEEVDYLDCQVIDDYTTKFCLRDWKVMYEYWNPFSRRYQDGIEIFDIGPEVMEYINKCLTFNGSLESYDVEIDDEGVHTFTLHWKEARDWESA